MPEKKYPLNKPPMHRTVRIPLGLDEALEAFLKTPQAWQMGFRHKADVVTEAVRQLLINYDYYRMSLPRGAAAAQRGTAEEPRE
jgi:hypothetical protein